jgi:hypothetical protein
VFPEGVSYAQGAFGTAESPVFFLKTGDLSDTNNSLVAPMGFEPTLPPCQRSGVVRHAALESKHDSRVATRS